MSMSIVLLKNLKIYFFVVRVAGCCVTKPPEAFCPVALHLVTTLQKVLLIGQSLCLDWWICVEVDSH
jgi:hypothetical protein